MAKQKMFIPTFIANQQFQPAQVLPRIFFYNGKLETTNYQLNNRKEVSAGTVETTEIYPYFDHYSVVSGSEIPTTDSDSLLFFNEAASLGTTPNNSVYSEYWSKYITLLYDPKTRLIECAGVIPFADYVELELNDIVFFRGNHYHLRAINQYNLKTGECQLQLLGPIIDDALDDQPAFIPPPPPPPPEVFTYASTRTSGAVTCSYVDPYGVERTISHNSGITRWFAGQSITLNINSTITSGSLTIPNDDVVSGSLDSGSVVNTDVTASANGVPFFASAYWLSGSTYDRYFEEIYDAGGSSQISNTCMISGSLILPDVQNGFSTLTINENGSC